MAKKHVPVDEQLRKAIATAEREGVSRYRIAMLTGKSRSQIHSIADGKVIPKLDTAEEIANAIGYSISINKEA